MPRSRLGSVGQVLFCGALSQGLLERAWFWRSPFLLPDPAVDIEQLRRAVAQKEALVKRLEAELEKEDRELIELEKELEKAEEQAE